MSRSSSDDKNPLIAPENVEPIALISSDKAGERALPAAHKIAQRWLPLIRAQLRRSIGLTLEVELSGAEVVQSQPAREELTRNWYRAVRVPEARPLVLSIGGPIVERVAGLLLGGELEEDMPERPPSPASRGIFTRAGNQVFNALCTAWRRERDQRVELVQNYEQSGIQLRRMLEREELLVIAIRITSPAPGFIKIFAEPETISPPHAETPPAPVPHHIVDRALGEVPVVLTVQLGQAHLSMKNLADLKPGDLIELDHTSEDLLPVFCEGIATALARPLVADGALAVEIVTNELVKENQT